VEVRQAGVVEANPGPVHRTGQVEEGGAAAGIELQDQVQRLQDQGQASQYPDQYAGAEARTDGACKGC